MRRNHERLAHIRSVIEANLDPIEPPFIHPKAFVNYNVEMGKDVVVGPNTSIGWYGVGCEWDENGHLVRFPQYGSVKIGDNVFICANSVIDASANDENVTEIGNRCVIGPKAHICHNVKIGNDTVVLGDAIVCGGAVIGERVMIGANATVLNKVKIGDEVIVGAGSVVTKDIPDRMIVKGNPGRCFDDKRKEC